jgi:orotate phosphoribosyltransferase
VNEFAKILCDIGAVKIQPNDPYTFTSGWKSPIYIDCRMIISFPKQRDRVIDALCDQVKQFAQRSKIDFIAGGETAGIPYAAFIADRLKIPMIYVRKKAKEFGTKSSIEGVINTGWNGVLVEDLMTDGRSKEMFAQSISSAGGSVKYIIVVVRYDLFPSVVIEPDVRSLVTTREIINHLIDDQIVDKNASRALELFRDNPVLWSSRMGGRAQ